MKLLLDTHVALWWLQGDDLDAAAAAAIAEPANDVLVSAASIWEVEIKRAIGKLTVDGDVAASLQADEIDALPITWAHAEEAGRLPRHHADPFDRMLIAQARLEGLTIVTRDRRFGDYDVVTLRG